MSGAQPPVAAVILCGGRGQRMGGQDKGLVLYRGQALVEHVLQRVRPQVSAICLSANRNQERYARYGLPVLPDAEPDFPGPLAGVSAALHWCPADWLLVVPCDTPCLPPDLVSILLNAAMQHGWPAVSVRDPERDHPVIHLLRRDLLPALQHWRQQGGAAVRGWLAQAGAGWVEFPDPGAFANCNTPDAVRD